MEKVVENVSKNVEKMAKKPLVFTKMAEKTPVVTKRLLA